MRVKECNNKSSPKAIENSCVATLTAENALVRCVC